MDIDTDTDKDTGTWEFEKIVVTHTYMVGGTPHVCLFIFIINIIVF